MLTVDTDTPKGGCVDVERKLARKAGNNARSTVGSGCNLSPTNLYQSVLQKS